MAKDADLFTAAMVGVTPLKGVKRRGAAAAATTKSPARATAAGPAPRPASAAAKPPPPGLEPFDREIDRALARGRRRPQATLDLHGMTLTTAERAVAEFL